LGVTQPELGAVTAGLAGLVLDLDDSTLGRLSDMLMKGELTSEVSASRVEDLLGIHGPKLQSIVAVLRASGESSGSLALSLATGIEVRKRILASQDKLSLVWTGPVKFSIPARSTNRVMQEIIGSTKSHITILGYALTKGASPLVRTLAGRVEAGVDARLILDEAESQLGVLKGMWPKDLELPHVYKNNSRALHAKLTVADSRDVLVTSANLTYFGLRSNIEMGVRVQGGFALGVESLILKLTQAGYFTEISP
jgi:phosphatidylserine/phosphatidylglycerophosphate/cardiolipin synthase-like enzyme